jgi:hypothetical protein
MAPGTALNEAGAAAVCASAGAFISRLPVAIPKATPTATADTIVIVLLIVAPHASTTWQSLFKDVYPLCGVADFDDIVY